mmetsp:Transcript_28998/g.68308  ORF Transcript_28998/g.68308 Transcript_28998/m.68308 type:complete len:357 (+) Transcript_28998:105-1175(+)
MQAAEYYATEIRKQHASKAQEEEGYAWLLIAHFIFGALPSAPPFLLPSSSMSAPGGATGAVRPAACHGRGSSCQELGGGGLGACTALPPLPNLPCGSSSTYSSLHFPVLFPGPLYAPVFALPLPCSSFPLLFPLPCSPQPSGRLIASRPLAGRTSGGCLKRDPHGFQKPGPCSPYCNGCMRGTSGGIIIPSGWPMPGGGRSGPYPKPFPPNWAEGKPWSMSGMPSACSIGGSPGGTKPKFAFTGKKLRRKCSDLMAAFSGFPLKDCERSQRTTSWAPSSTLNFTNQVLFTSGFTLTTFSAYGPDVRSCMISSSVVPSGRSRRMTTFRLDLSTGRTMVLWSSTPRRLDFAAAAATWS